MDVSNCWCSLVLCFIYLLAILLPCATCLNFSLANIGPDNQNREIVTEGEGSYISNQGVQVTPDEYDTERKSRAGRAIYIRPLHLWDNASGQLADFSTNFSFVIDSKGSDLYGDGLSFFLAENNSVIMVGGALGLPIDLIKIRPTNRFVAVEFDTHWNEWDPKDEKNVSIGDHVGININSIVSVQSEKWWSNITNGKVNEARVIYDSTSKNLSVVFTGFVNDISVEQYGLRWTVDLRNELPEWVIFGFAASTGDSFEKNNVKSWSFSSSDLQVELPLPRNSTEQVELPRKTTEPRKGTSKRRLVVGLSIGLSVFVGGIASILGWFLCIKNMRRDKKEMELGFNVRMDDLFKISSPKRYQYDELARATSDFAEDKKLGQGGFGGVYRGFLTELSSDVAVKKVSRGSTQGIKEYASEVGIISRLRHRNLVQLIGWCHEERELLLVYEFLKNGSLDSHLFKEKSLLAWEQRYKIAQGLASALLYLHEEWEQCVLHRDIKSSNVMLDSNFNAKLGDFGLAKLVDHEKESETACLAGTFGYMAPERFLTGKASKGSDVYSFGVVALEIACGRKSIDLTNKECPVRLVDVVWELYGRGKLIEAADPKLAAEFDEEQMERLMITGLWCAHPDLNLRPSIKQAIQVLDSEASLPRLPLTVPVPTYVASPINMSASWLSFSYGFTGSGNEQTQPSNSTTSRNSSHLFTSLLE